MAAERESTDPMLTALMREHSTETPPAHVDAAILAAAHASVASASRDRSVSLHDAGAPALARMAWRWWMPLAAAAVIGVIAIGVIPLAPSIVDDATQRASDAPEAFNARAARDAASSVAAPKVDTQGAVPRDDAPSSVAAQRREGQAPAAPDAASSVAAPKLEPQSLAKQHKRDDLGLNRQESNDTRPPQEFAPSPPQAATLQGAPLPAPALPAEEQSVAKSPPPAVQPPTASAQSPAPAPAASGAPASVPPAPGSDLLSVRPRIDDSLHAQRETRVGSVRGDELTEQPNIAERQKATRDAREIDAPSRSATDWARRIRELRDAGRTDDALRALREFRAAFADADRQLPADLAQWARTQR